MATLDGYCKKKPRNKDTGQNSRENGLSVVTTNSLPPFTQVCLEESDVPKRLARGTGVCSGHSDGHQVTRGLAVFGASRSDALCGHIEAPAGTPRWSPQAAAAPPHSSRTGRAGCPGRRLRSAPAPLPERSPALTAVHPGAPGCQPNGPAGLRTPLPDLGRCRCPHEGSRQARGALN